MVGVITAPYDLKIKLLKLRHQRYRLQKRAKKKWCGDNTDHWLKEKQRWIVRSPLERGGRVCLCFDRSLAQHTPATLFLSRPLSRGDFRNLHTYLKA
jgi:hypothetical protein